MASVQSANSSYWGHMFIDAKFAMYSATPTIEWLPTSSPMAIIVARRIPPLGAVHSSECVTCTWTDNRN